MVNMIMLPGSLVANLASPPWQDPDGVGLGSDWHYRLPVTFTSGSTALTDTRGLIPTDFNAQLAALGVSGTFDNNSVRVIYFDGSTNYLLPRQVFVDNRFNGDPDPNGNGRGDVEIVLDNNDNPSDSFTLPANSSITYYVYFDIIENGAKPVLVSNPLLPNFASPAQPGAATLEATYDTQIGGINKEIYNGQQGAGVLATDGVYLFIKSWSENAGPNRFHKIGSGYGGTVSGQDYGTINAPHGSGQQSISATYFNGYIYDPRPNTTNTIEKIDVNTGVMTTVTTNLLRYDTGSVSSGYHLITTAPSYATTPTFTGTGNGTISQPLTGINTISETYTVTCTSTATNGGTFTITRTGGAANPTTLVLPGTPGG